MFVCVCACARARVCASMCVCKRVSAQGENCECHRQYITNQEQGRIQKFHQMAKASKGMISAAGTNAGRHKDDAS